MNLMMRRIVSPFRKAEARILEWIAKRLTAIAIAADERAQGIWKGKSVLIHGDYLPEEKVYCCYSNKSIDRSLFMDACQPSYLSSCPSKCPKQQVWRDFR